METKATKGTNDFRSQMLNLTKATLQSKSRGLSKKQIFHDLLFENKKLSRQEIVFEISMKVVESKFSVESLDSENQEQIDYFKTTYKTVKNSVDTIVSNSNNSATYANDKNYSEFELKKENDKYFIVKKTK